MEIDEETLEQIIGVPEEEVIANENDNTDTIEEEYSIIPIDDTTMYCISGTANIRSGAGTQYDKVGSLSYGQEVVIHGKVEDGDKLWYVIKTSDESIQMVSGSLLSETKPQQQQNTGNNQQSTGNNQQTQQPQVQQPEVEEPAYQQPSGSTGDAWLDEMLGQSSSGETHGAGGDPTASDWDLNWQ